jgi:hypothetical protein
VAVNLLTSDLDLPDDARSRARDFIEKHGLSPNYEAEIVSFIKRFGPR